MIIAQVLLLTVNAGNSRLLRSPAGPSPIPAAGSHPSFTENSNTPMSPSQKPGMAAPIRATTVAVWSKNVYCFRADMIPAGTPITIAINTALLASIKVLGSFSKI